MGYEGGFTNLRVWQKAHQLTLFIYKITDNFPDKEQFALTSQMRRAGYSIPANIAEGHKRRSDKEYISFLKISGGSLEEIKYFCILARDLKYINEESYKELTVLCDEVGRMLFSLINKLKA